MPNCKNCQQQFEITSQDKSFYQKIDVPEPKICPDCRSQKRQAYRNEKSFYNRQCDHCNKNIISIYSQDKKFPVYCQDCFWSDKWNPLKFGINYNLNKTFSEQFKSLIKKVPRLAIVNKQSENSDYCNYSFANKNCYLTFGSHYEEGCMYGRYSTKNKDCLDYLWLYNSELCYECTYSGNCYNCIFLDHCNDCQDCFFSVDLKACKNCLFCANLRNKEYCILNKQYSKEEYNKKIKNYNLKDYNKFNEALEFYLKDFREKFYFRASYQTNCENCDGNNLKNSKNLKHCLDATSCESCSYGFQLDETYNSMDINYMGYDRSELCYQTIGCTGVYNCMVCDSCWHSNDLFYCNLCFSSKNCFGCISLQKGDYCILNKQYNKKQYLELKKKIIKQMKQDKEWGEFFSNELYPFAYNESVANEHFLLNKEQALDYKWQWQDEKEVKIISSLPICISCNKNFKVTSQEKVFYKNLNISEQKKCPECRLRNRQKRFAKKKLYNKECVKCSKKIKSAYKTETVYCEDCYKKEIY